MGGGVVGVNLECGFEVFSGLDELALSLKEEAVVGVGVGMVGVNLQCGL